ncbi:type IV toxin-antitoxin system AbiEi family antitoxin domain-containing protein [Nocardioides sp. Kera G14]|uniref:type IV toxin-antitoxin system AbiEi family antitoxin domain-containing protein n=1 Tax=Nocardioides sp. Kera G14 TaxID=2884264 RepID=UPI001D12827A|nr:type IV toxin-antitoxin system AbiEi family antitoxin domain-containing protein [Nocardioides sp. Kera G14]UDY23164.1 hypothetical protein LH076_14000 [Nocardioides sp. Kera G14]
MEPELVPIFKQQLEFERTRQSGVLTWAQLLGGGWTRSEVRRAVRRRDLVRVYPRVYVDHTGPLSPEQRAWAAVLWAEPAALCLESLTGVPAGATTVHVAIDRARSLTPPSGVTVHRVAGLNTMIRVNTSPPRLTLEDDLAIRLAAARDETEMVGMLADTVGRFGTTAAAVRRALERHPRVPRRRLVLALLDDIEGGTESVLEHGFLNRVERPHGLPTPTRQAVRRDGAERRDLDYEEFGLVVELDGRLNHESWTAGNRDAGRDLADVAEGGTVLRLRWTQVMVQSCETARLLARALWARGWRTVPTSCGPTCAIRPPTV